MGIGNAATYERSEAGPTIDGDCAALFAKACLVLAEAPPEAIKAISLEIDLAGHQGEAVSTWLQAKQVARRYGLRGTADLRGETLTIHFNRA